MQSLHRRFSVITGFGLLLIVLVANAIITKRQLGTQVENQLWLSHSRLVLFELAQTESLLKDAETGQRGFLYTGIQSIWHPYNLAIGQVGPSIDKVAQLTADNPRQQGRIPALRNLAQSKLKERAQTIALYRSGEPEKAKALVLSDAGLFMMNDIRKLTGEIADQSHFTRVFKTVIGVTPQTWLDDRR
jgi:CHASE3 domain sensor protein